MYFDDSGLVVDNQGNQQIYYPWKHVQGIYSWVLGGKSYSTYPGAEFSREEVAFILSHYVKVGE